MPNFVRLAGAFAFALVATSAVAEEPRSRIDNFRALWAAMEQCWRPPPIEQARLGMQITVLMSIKRNGELLGKPRITYELPGASDDDRLAYRLAVAAMIERCTPLPLTDAFAGAIAGRPFTMRFIDSRQEKRAEHGPGLERLG
jgi:hypothetical protein